MEKIEHKTKRKLACPACGMAIYFRPEIDDLGVCPGCGEWLTAHGRKNRHLKTLDPEYPPDFDEGSN